MGKIFAILGLFLLLAATLIAPAQSAYAASRMMVSPVMQMQADSVCCTKDCKTMPDCPMALPGLPGLFAVQGSAAMAIVGADLLSDGFPLITHAALSSLSGDRLRRPPKI